MRVISRSSMAIRSALPDTNGCRQILMHERVPPQVEDTIRVGDALRRIAAAHPGEAEVHRVVDGEVERDIQQFGITVFDEIREVVGGSFRRVDEALLLQQRQAVVAARADRSLAGQGFQGSRRLQQMVPLQVRVLGDVMFPHVVGDFVATRRRRLHRARVEFGDAAGGEDRRLDVVGIKQLDQPPDADAAAEFTLGKLLRRFVHQAAEQHRVEIGGEVDGDADALGVGDLGQARVMGVRLGCRIGQLVEFLQQRRIHCHPVPLPGS